MTREEKIKKLIKLARSFVGVPYQYGAYLVENSEEAPRGFDCSSFSQYVFRQVGVGLPRSSILQAASDMGEEIPVSQMEAGDVLFFEGTKGHYWHSRFNGKKIYIGHLAIYTGNGNIIHAADNKEINPILQGVVEHYLDILPKSYYDVVMVKRFV